MQAAFDNFDLSEFWTESEYSVHEYVCDPPTDELIDSVERELGYKIPASYIELMRNQNGGIPKKHAIRTSEATSWADDYFDFTIEVILAIGREKRYSLCGEFGSKFMIENWGYPDIGIYFGVCTTAGHDMICLDYRKNGRTGEPEVIHVDQGDHYKTTFLAPTFETFVKGLVDDSEF